MHPNPLVGLNHVRLEREVDVVDAVARARQIVVGLLERRTEVREDLLRLQRRPLCFQLSDTLSKLLALRFHLRELAFEGVPLASNVQHVCLQANDRLLLIGDHPFDRRPLDRLELANVDLGISSS